MPYTPPSQASPLASPNHSRPQSSSRNGKDASTSADSSVNTTAERPRSSSSYLYGHRRSPSLTWSAPGAGLHKYDDRPSSPRESGDEPALISESLRQSPPPRSNASIPIGAVVSPPESSHGSSDDDEDSDRAGRSRERQNTDWLELQEAARTIAQKPSGSPDRRGRERDGLTLNVDIPSPRTTLSIPSEDVTSPRRTVSASNLATSSTPAPLTHEARKISHSRSATDSSLVRDSSESDDDEDAITLDSRPSMLRKKSGELVKPALRPPMMQRRPSSAPGTPVYGKAVHFDSHLEEIRQFRQVDRPLAVSAGSSPVEQYESDSEFPFPSSSSSVSHGPLYEWELSLSNFPRADSPARKSAPVRVERVFLSADNKNLVGTVAVANISFHKQVVARFTFDYWRTTSEVVAEYNNDVPRRRHRHDAAPSDGYDRFNFTIKLADQANLENRAMFFCVRYAVNGQEYWDNNNAMNYQVEFRKMYKPQHGKSGSFGQTSPSLDQLPRSRPNRHNRVKSHPATYDDLVDSIDQNRSFDLRLLPPRRHKPKTTVLMGDEDESPSRPRFASPRSGSSALAPRYDFGASIQATKATTSNKRPTSPPAAGEQNTAIASILGDKPALESPHYFEFVDKYCFAGTSKKSKPVTAVSTAATEPAQTTQPTQSVSAPEKARDGTGSGSGSATGSSGGSGSVSRTGSLSRTSSLNGREGQSGMRTSRSASPASMGSHGSHGTHAHGGHGGEWGLGIGVFAQPTAIHG